MKTHVYIFSESYQAEAYGIGTYIQSIKSIFIKNDKYILNIIHVSSNYSECCVKYSDKNVIEYYIPDSFYRFNKNTEKAYYRNIWYILVSYVEICKQKKSIFIFNYYKDIYIIKKIKERLKNSYVIFTIHYQNWCFLLKGNLDYYESIIKNSQCVKNKLDKDLLDSFLMEKYVYENVDKIICLCEYTKNILHKLYNIEKKKIVLIYNGLSPNIKKMCKYDKIVYRNKIGIKRNKMLILFVGRLDEIKGVDILLEAFCKLENTNKYHLLIAGNGDYNKYLKLTNMRTNISFLGFLEKDKLYKLYQICDIGIMLSFHEQCSYVAIEFMMHGVPLIYSTSTGLKEMAQGVSIPVIKKDDTCFIKLENVKKAILYLSDKSVRNRFSIKSRTSYSNKYTLSRMEHSICNLFDKFNY